MAKFGPKLAFLANNRHFWSIWSNGRPKNNADKLLRWFFRCVGTKTFWPNNGQISPKICIFGYFRPNWHFWAIWYHAWPKKHAHKVPRCFFFTWVPKLLLPPIRIRIFGPKTSIFPQIMLSCAHIGLASSFGALLVGLLVVLTRGLYLARHLFTL